MIGYRGYVRYYSLVVSTTGIVIGGLTVLLSVMTSVTGFMVAGGIFGIFSGGFHSQRITIVSEFVPKHLISDIVGISVFCQGLGNAFLATFGGQSTTYASDF